MLAFSGTLSSSAYDTQQAGSATATSVTLPSMTPASDGEVIVVFGGNAGSSNMNINSGVTEVDDVAVIGGTAFGIVTGYKIQGALAAIAPTVAYDSGSAFLPAGQLAIKPASYSGGATLSSYYYNQHIARMAA